MYAKRRFVNIFFKILLFYLFPASNCIVSKECAVAYANMFQVITFQMGLSQGTNKGYGFSLGAMYLPFDSRTCDNITIFYGIKYRNSWEDKPKGENYISGIDFYFHPTGDNLLQRLLGAQFVKSTQFNFIGYNFGFGYSSLESRNDTYVNRGFYMQIGLILVPWSFLNMEILYRRHFYNNDNSFNEVVLNFNIL
ncbi:hypothetical protein CQA66_07080 [Helicobacter aurati]|uniref:Outer membrane beta-barrel protein n=1 Tax=Helicobacter aurati TaxID=137778 RepID=A0A3D8J0I4_9HELI|nr:hypothetical protein [Helicobacter aurati]RDU71052.1 hypothetical protein CQA66_07080 [Helicobacter aurati]